MGNTDEPIRNTYFILTYIFYVFKLKFLFFKPYITWYLLLIWLFCKSGTKYAYLFKFLGLKRWWRSCKYMESQITYYGACLALLLWTFCNLGKRKQEWQNEIWGKKFLFFFFAWFENFKKDNCRPSYDYTNTSWVIFMFIIDMENTCGTVKHSFWPFLIDRWQFKVFKMNTCYKTNSRKKKS